MLRRNPKVEEAPLQSELMLFDPVSSQFYVLNNTMAWVWRNWDESPNLPDLAARLAREFDGADPAEVAADLQSALDDLRKLGLLLDSEAVGV